MIHFALKCDQGHSFESWFQSSEAFDKLLAAGMVSCSVCGSPSVEKALMAPRVQTGRDKPLSKPASEAEQAIAELRRKVEESATYVGGNFAKEARAIHEGEKPDRPIYGEARPEEARALIEDGVPVLPLPFSAGRKTN
ncbi:DUF1178 family protein [Pseudooceanicola sp. CBS1P-1]|uniref:DUF1178 family protein n=1 Tax=Pseudooceanicola albus TaxID=2692189 RepID=A0A6L7G171_9RHOB|nr:MULTISPECIES: DUF1178 family protein [Pseudooceanicola]MBT9382667.1 DUF1178 family protein [Pseudooceanicola endophyticus]MXN17206.1 DUF1178 family protein [Pseudooceanicola albus]